MKKRLLTAIADGGARLLNVGIAPHPRTIYVYTPDCRLAAPSSPDADRFHLQRDWRNVAGDLAAALRRYETGGLDGHTPPSTP